VLALVADGCLLLRLATHSEHFVCVLVQVWDAELAADDDNDGCMLLPLYCLACLLARILADSAAVHFRTNLLARSSPLSH
jgi:hypothetical protein